MWDVAKSDVPLCAENEKEKAENRKRHYLFDISLYYLYMAHFFPSIGGCDAPLKGVHRYGPIGGKTTESHFGKKNKCERYFPALLVAMRFS